MFCLLRCASVCLHEGVYVRSSSWEAPCVWWIAGGESQPQEKGHHHMEEERTIIPSPAQTASCFHGVAADQAEARALEPANASPRRASGVRGSRVGRDDLVAWRTPHASRSEPGRLVYAQRESTVSRPPGIRRRRLEHDRDGHLHASMGSRAVRLPMRGRAA